MDSKHTPGPWTAKDMARDGGYIATSGGRTVFACDGQGAPGDADARLIAAAPELLAALRELVREADANAGEVTCDAVEAARAAIAKATVEAAQ